MKQATTPDSNAPADKRADYETRCFELLHTVIDGEASAEEVDFFNTYSRECLPVYQLYQLDVAIKQLIASRLQKKRAPHGLIETIKSRIHETRA
ncbi:MAG: hypothetical protein WBA12_04450 [Catalinimonas sp.]